MNKHFRYFLLASCVCGGIAPTYADRNVETLQPVLSVNQQSNITAQGTVVDANGEPVIGATIKVKGTATGTVTGIEGDFTLNVPQNAILEISYIGYATQEITIRNNDLLRIVLKEDSKQLDEVVVVGFGTQKKVNLTGSVSNVDSKVFEGRAVSNATQALQGAMPGLNITQTKGYLDQSPSINVRGVGTIGEGSDASPLILIDGMEGDINRINPQDIESVSVLKDAAASSIYGSRAPFGVILITTKKGKQGKFSATYNNSFRWQKPINMPKLADSYTFATYFNETATNGGTTGHFSEERLQKIKDFQASGATIGGIDPNPLNPTQWLDLYDYGYANTDWFKLMFKDVSFSHEHNMSVTGGTEKAQIYASANYLSQEGFIALNPESNNRISTNLKASFQLNKHINVNYGIRYNYTRYEKPTALGDNTFTQLTRQGWPTLTAYDPNGYLYAYATPALAMRDGGRSKTKSDEMVQMLNIVIEPIKGWKIIGDLNYKAYNERVHSDVQKIYNHDTNGDPVQYTLAGSDSKVTETYGGHKYLNPNIYTEYEHTLKDHYFKVMVGFQSEHYWGDGLEASRLGIIVPGINTLNTTSGNDASGKAVPSTIEGDYNKWATAGFFGRLNYNYKERYLLETNLRYDGTSRFRKDKRWNWFPSFSVGWNVAREAFFEPLTDLISTLKIRGSYGELGNQNTESWYPTYLTMPIGITDSGWLINGAQYNTASAPGLISSTMGWETVRTINIGADINMLNNRLGITFDWFKRNTDDMIGPAPDLLLVLGTDVPKTNNTDLVTKGWELTISYRDRLPNGLGYNASFNISDSKTKILNYPNRTGTVTDYYSGKDLGEIWGFETIGIAKTNEEMEQHLASLPNGGQQTMGTNWAAGDIMYKDLNGDGKIDWGNTTYEDLGDMKVIGNTSPRYAFGINLGADYKGFDINIFFQGIMQRDYYTTDSQDFWGAGGGLWDSTCLTDHLDYFRNDEDHPLGVNLDSYYPRPLWSSKNKHAQTRYLLDASYIRLKNLSIGYTIPQGITRKAGVDKLRIFFTGENLWTGTSLPSMYDPETIDSNNGRMMYPLSKVYSVGLSVSF